MQSTAFKGTTIAFKASAKPARALQRRVQVCCSADPSDHLSRRGLIGALTASVAAAPMLLSASPAEAKMVDKVISAKYLSAFQRADLINAFQVSASIPPPPFYFFHSCLLIECVNFFT